MDLIDEYCSWLRHNKGRADRTVDKYRQQLERLDSFLAESGQTLASAELGHLEAYAGVHAHQKLQLNSRARRPLVAAVRGFYAWAYDRGHIALNPANRLEYPKTGRPLPRAMSMDSAERLLMQCDLEEFTGARDAAMLSILIGCGPRISGVCALNQEDLLWYQEDGRERLAIRFTEKGGKERIEPAPHETALYLHAYLGHPDLDAIDRTLEDGQHVLFVSTRNRKIPEHEYHGEARRIATRSFFDRMRKYGEAAGIPEEQLHPHALRHLFGTQLAEHDVDLLLRQELMGHADPKTTEIYTALAMRKKTETMDRASPIRHIRSHVSELARRLESKARRRSSS